MVERSSAEPIGFEDALQVGDPTVVDARSRLELQVLAQIRDNLTLIHREQRDMRESMKSVDEKIGDARERIIRLEERDTRLNRVETDLERHREQLGALLKDKDNRDGAMRFGNWLLRYGPALVGIIVAVVIVMVTSGRIN